MALENSKTIIQEIKKLIKIYTALIIVSLSFKAPVYETKQKCFARKS